jgi:hypothetical protein
LEQRNKNEPPSGGFFVTVFFLPFMFISKNGQEIVSIHLALESIKSKHLSG